MSESSIDWPFWRESLLRMEEGAIIDIIEIKYPVLSVESEGEVHICVDEEEELAIVAHNANREENFLLLPFNLKEKIQLYFGTGVRKWSRIRKREDLQELLFKSHEPLLGFKKYSFSNNQQDECKVLKTAHEWLNKNNDDGFAIKGYDMKQHLKHFTVDYKDKNPYNDSYVLIYSDKYNVILHVDTHPKDINTAIRNNRSYIRYLRTLHQCLVERAIIFLPVILCDESSIDEVSSVRCDSCEELGLVVPKKTFEELSSLENWWITTEENNKEISEVVNQTNQKGDVTNDLLKSIIGYMIGVTLFDLPNFNKNPRFKNQSGNKEENLKMLQPEYHDIISYMKQIVIE